MPPDAPPRIRYSDTVTIPCKALNHAYDEQRGRTFRERSAYYGWVWVQYMPCRRDCGRVQVKILPEGGGRPYRTYYLSENPAYDTTMPKADAVREHQRMTREVTQAEIETAEQGAASTVDETSTSV